MTLDTNLYHLFFILLAISFVSMTYHTVDITRYVLSKQAERWDASSLQVVNADVQNIARTVSEVIVMLWYSQWRQMTSHCHYVPPIERSARCRWHKVSEFSIAASCTIRFFGLWDVFKMIREPDRCHQWWHRYMLTLSWHSAWLGWRRYVRIRVLVFAPNLFLTNRMCLCYMFQ